MKPATGQGCALDPSPFGGAGGGLNFHNPLVSAASFLTFNV